MVELPPQPALVTGYGPEVSGADSVPLRYDAVRQGEYARWLPFAKPFLLIPHLACLALLLLALLPASLAAALGVFATGRYPRPLFDFVVGVFRWVMRVASYLYLLTDRYPPFSLRADPAYPVQFELELPPNGRIARWRPLVSWFLVLPQLASLLVVYASVYLMLLLALLSIVMTRTFPPGVFDFIVRALRFNIRVNAYALFLTQPYPRFRL